MKPIDRIIFAAIAVALMLLALQPYLAQRWQSLGQGTFPIYSHLSEHVILPHQHNLLISAAL